MDPQVWKNYAQIIVFIGSALVLLGSVGVWTFGNRVEQRRKAESEREKAIIEQRTAERDAALRKLSESESKNTPLLRDIAVHMGNEESLKELIETRRQALGADRNVAGDLLQDVLRQLPSTTQLHRKLEDDEAKSYEKERIRFRATWEPLLRETIAAFDRCAAELQASGRSVKVRANDEFQITLSAGAGQPIQELRVIEFRGGELKLLYVPAVLNDKQGGPGELMVEVVHGGRWIERSFDRMLSQHEKEYSAERMKANVDEFRQRLAKATEKMLLLADDRRAQ